MTVPSRLRPAEDAVVGIDFGTLSGRAVVVRVSDGAELGSAVVDYPHAVLDRTLPGGTVLPPDWALQVPGDYVKVVAQAVPAALRDAGVSAGQVIGIGTDFTACTVLPTTADGTPLCELPQYSEEPHAFVKLWKHHAAQPQADRINAVARDREERWLGRYGGGISSEWEFAKGLQILEEAPHVYEAMDRFVEAADWIVWQLCGNYLRNACTAGYKGIYQDGSYPSRDFLTSLNPDFAGFVEDKLDQPMGQMGTRAGGLTAKAARLTGLREGTVVAVGNVDAHVTAAAAKAVSPGQMVAIMGTSTCHVLSSSQFGEVPGVCGVVADGIVPGLWGYEAGQSGVGDIFNWFVTNQLPGAYQRRARDRRQTEHEYLSALAGEQPVGQHGLIALDWHSGNRSVLVDHELSGLLVGQTLATRPEDVYRALLEATAYGTRIIVDSFNASGVPVEELIIAGGLTKNRLLMQIYSNVLNMPLSLIGSSQGPAVGAAIHAAVAAGAYPDILTASAAMGRVTEHVYAPNKHDATAYRELYEEYRTLHDYFGRGANDVMHRLKRTRREAHSREQLLGEHPQRGAAKGREAGVAR